MGLSVQFEPARSYAKNVVFIDGITRSGKFWMVHFLYQIENIEHVRHDPTMDHVAVASFFKMIGDNVAISLLQGMLNRQLYENLIGRNLNFRYADSSSVLKNPDLQKYLMRVIGPDRDPQETFSELKESNNWFVFLVHDWLSHLKIQLEAFPAMKLIRVERNLIDLVYAWYSKGIGRDRMAFGIRIKSNYGSVPWFAFPWLDSFDSLCEMDRIILSILTLHQKAKETYETLSISHKKQVLFTSYEEMAGTPLDTINDIATFLGTSVRDSVWTFIEEKVFRERNRSNLTASREVKKQFIQERASHEVFSRLEDSVTKYENSQLS
ncbi:MAG: sulfotransferase domain-containing protein [Deltaproteobacteria bacterium]|nr:sulfotransferase domain-containing protein [Deltaproteobacteria bacterium]